MTAQEQIKEPQYVQGSAEWLTLRKTKITATDASIILGINPWKSKAKLFEEKINPNPPEVFLNSAMQRGIDLEPLARELYILKTGIDVEPAVIIKDWAMASLDGMSKCGKYILEIKCPGEKDHAIALAGKVPENYYPQLQHQIFVCDVDFAHYFSFDGMDGVLITVARDQTFIDKMIVDELKFYECLQNKTPPEPDANDFVFRDDKTWIECAENYKQIKETLKALEEEEERLRKQLIFLSGDVNSKGAGLSLTKIERKGLVDYSKVPELKGVDLEPYRKASSSSWRILL